MTNDNRVDTGHAGIALADSGGDGPAILLVHGNSSCKEVFSRQFADPGLARFRLLAPDLPGHGASENARDPHRTYEFAGYAQMLEELLGIVGVEKPLIFGWSLGGHIALELVGRGFAVAGVMISGTPPIRPDLECLMAAFHIDPAAENLTGKKDFTDADALAYATHTSAVDGRVDPHLLAMVRRTDGRAREIMFGSVVAGQPLDEQKIVAAMKTPLAIVNGEADPFIRQAYFGTLAYASLWPRGVVQVADAGHAPFLQQPQAFNALLEELRVETA